MSAVIVLSDRKREAEIERCYQNGLQAHAEGRIDDSILWFRNMAANIQQRTAEVVEALELEKGLR